MEGIVSVTVKCYLALVTALAVLLWCLGDEWWVATVMLFGPRWPILVPMMVLVPSGVWIWRRTAVWLLLAVILAVGPFMGMVMPWRTAMNVASGSPSHTLTWGEITDQSSRKSPFGLRVL